MNPTTLPDHSIQFPVTLSEAQCAALLGICVKTLRNMKSAGRGPVFVRTTPDTTVYLPQDITDYLVKNRVIRDASAPIAASKRRGRPRKSDEVSRRSR
jgi:hypothetical protein